MIATAETQSALLQHENLAIRNTLSKVNIPLPITSTATSSSKVKSPEQGQLVPSPESFQFQQDTQPGTTDATLGPKQVLQWQSRSPSNETLVSTHFDELIDASCLQIGQPDNLNYENDITMNSPDIFNFPNTTFTAPEPTPAPATNFSRPNPAPPDQVAAIRPADLTTIAINFILAYVLLAIPPSKLTDDSLEHPCRTHFHTNSSTFDPKGDHSGHELMASTLLYSHAPEPIFSTLDNAQWTMPSLELTQLHAMSQSLPKGDWEITPVQAWFMLAEKVGVGRVLGGGGTVIEKLKKGLGKLVGCFEFGAVMDEGRFWEVVGSVIGCEEEEG
jgi:hypothetical protein